MIITTKVYEYTSSSSQQLLNMFVFNRKYSGYQVPK